jgi:hypothetical protein
MLKVTARYSICVFIYFKIPYMHKYKATQSMREPVIFQMENQKGFLGWGAKLNVLFNSEGCKQKRSKKYTVKK